MEKNSSYNSAKYNAIDIAKYFIKKASNDGGISHLKLQKLLYYAQGWYLANYGRPLFKDEIEAWKFGPVIPNVYRFFSKFGSAKISTEEVPDCDNLSLESADQNFLDEVWKVYKDFSAMDLVHSTHNEKPWKQTKHDIDAHDQADSEIPLSLISDYFRTLKN